MPSNVRFATFSDAHELARLRWLSRPEHDQGAEVLKAFAERFQPWLHNALSSGSWWAAVGVRDSESLAGCMYLQRVATVPVPGMQSRAWGYVTHAFVEEASRGQGLGTALLAFLVRKAREEKLEELQVWPSSQAVSLYIRAGFISPEALRAMHHPEEASYVLPLAKAISEA